jgi:Bacterial membrane protein YfhO
LPLWRALALIAALKIFVAAFGMFLLGRALGMRFGGALLAGTVFGFSLWMVTWVSWPTVSVWAYLPWLCLLTEHLVRRPGPLPFAGLAGVVALQYFGGHPESCFHVLLATVLFWLMRVVAMRPPGVGAAARSTLVFMGALAAGTALAAITLVPFIEFLSHSADLEARRYLGSSHQAPRYLLGVLLHDYWGRETRVSLEFPAAMEERAYYVGALSLFLAAAALTLRSRWDRIAVAGVGAGALFVAIGIPPLFDLITQLPAFNTSHNARLAIFMVFVIALLSGWGLDDLAARASPVRRGRVLLAICATLLVLPVVVMAADGTLALDRIGSGLRVTWGFVEPSSSTPADKLGETVRIASLFEWLVLAALALLLVVLRLRGRLGTTAFTVCAVALLVADLFKAGMGYNPAIPIAHAEQPETGAIRYLQSQRPSRFVGLDAKAKLSLLAPMVPDVAMRYRLYDARGYDYPVERRYERLWHRYIATSRACLYAFCPQSVAARPQALRALGLFGVTHLLQNRRDRPLQDPDLSVAYAGSDGRIYSNPHALPRAFLVNRQEVVHDDSAALRTITSRGFRPRSVALTQQRVQGLPEVSVEEAARPGPPAGKARIVTYEPERVVVETEGARSALLVLTDTYFPGWEAKVDGSPARVRRVDYLLRGVSIPPGQHRVEFMYEPVSWRVAWLVSGLTLVGLLAAVFFGGRAKWKRH